MHGELYLQPALPVCMHGDLYLLASFNFQLDCEHCGLGVVVMLRPALLVCMHGELRLLARPWLPHQTVSTVA